MAYGQWLTQFRVQHLVWVRLHYSFTFGPGFNHIRLEHFLYDFTCEVLQYNVVEPKTKYCTLMVSTNNQLIQSNVVPPVQIDLPINNRVTVI